ncbi:nitrate ABC transporter substrate-binding protein [Salicibibacter halophilus]|uniref:Thiamine pyrimidine synthase n=2 Tax=Salicibibacter halophilus TaxID=2502791 RepID=A0A514LMC4_9BACI|nr:nitrate ABC transporter substrate-binding protein [Salicibibacter halophilus]
MASWSSAIAEQSNLYLAEQEGWFEESGLDFEYIPGEGGGEAVRNIVAGNADIAFANLEAVLLAAQQGEDFKIIYNIYPDNVFNVVSLKENNIQSIEDLEGKDVGVYSLESGTYQNLQVMLYDAGMTEEDVNVIETGVLNFGPLINEQVDAAAATDTGLYDAKEQGLGDVNVMEAKDVLNTPADVFVVTEEIFEEERETLLEFLQVYRDSAQHMMDYPDEAAAAAVGTAIDGEDEERNRAIIDIRNEVSINEEMEERGLGWLNAKKMAEVEETYVDIGLIDEPVGIAEMTTNELVEELD